MSENNNKNKTEFKELGGPFGVGETIKDIEELDVFETFIGTGQFAAISEGLTEEEKKHALKEAKAYADQYQKVLDNFTELLGTPEGKKAFREMALKKMRGR